MSNDLHNKYRPSAFEDVVGQDAVVKSLTRVLAAGTSRAFIFTGPSGCGKTTLARIVALQIGCDPSNIREIDAATYTGIEAMRSITSTLEFAALGASARMLIVDEAHALSKAAWQSLLKAVEEPPPDTYWAFCTTEAGKIPETIRTRCVVYDLKPVRLDVIEDLLQRIAEAEGLKLSPDLIGLAAEHAQGSPRKGITALAQIAGCANRQEAATLLQKVSESDPVHALCSALTKGLTSWEQAMKLVKPLEGQAPEGIRIVVAAYLTTVLKNTKDPRTAAGLLNTLSAFSTPYDNQTALTPLLLSLGQVVFAS